MKNPAGNAEWIWIEKDVENAHRYGCFRRAFVLEKPANGELLVSANWDFIAYLNGHEIARGQFPDYPEKKTYSTISLKGLKLGRNVISFLVYNSGEDFFASLKAPAGLWIKLSIGEETIITDSSWKCAKHSAFYSGEMPKLTPQLGFTTLCDLNKEQSWADPDFDDSEWKDAFINSAYKPEMTPRPLDMIELDDRADSKIVKSGWINRENATGTFAEQVVSDKYNFSADKVICDGKLVTVPENYNGAAVIFDLGMEQVGFIEVELIAGEGTVIDISHGEHLADGIVRARIGDRNFTDRLICKNGTNLYHLPFRRIGGRYIQLNLTKLSGSVEVIYVGIRPWVRPLPRTATFECDSPEAADFREIGLHTMRMCMHDHYEDCPWREQGLYSYDSRNQMIFGYYAWGNYNFARTSLELLGRGIGPDGHLNLCAPTHRSIIIPIFSHVWITAVYEYYLYSGDVSLLEEFSEQFKTMVDLALKPMDSQTGLIEVPDPDQYWNFSEWVPGLDGGTCGGIEEGRPAKHEFQSPYNLYVYEMLNSYIEIMRALGENTEADKIDTVRKRLGSALEAYFWDAKEHCYITRQAEKFMLHEHTQYLMFALGLVPPEKQAEVMDSLHSGKLAEQSFSPMLYMLQGLFQLSEEERCSAVDRINRIYRKMVNHGATTFWETEDGEAAFDNAGSLCHAWSSIHVYYYGALVLGVKPLEPGFRKFEVKPWAGEFGQAAGTIPTPSGMIYVEWNKQPDNSLELKVSHPAELKPEISSYKEYPVGKIEINELPL